MGMADSLHSVISGYSLCLVCDFCHMRTPSVADKHVAQKALGADGRLVFRRGAKTCILGGLRMHLPSKRCGNARPDTGRQQESSVALLKCLETLRSPQMKSIPRSPPYTHQPAALTSAGPA